MRVAFLATVSALASQIADMAQEMEARNEDVRRLDSEINDLRSNARYDSGELDQARNDLRAANTELRALRDEVYTLRSTPTRDEDANRPSDIVAALNAYDAAGPGDRIAAIKAIRSAFKLGLKEAKDIVEATTRYKRNVSSW